ncbi:bifunctional folylpolyglutamate synthase/dihydrofolate synthase [Aridibaculum aurantiacum]|uniref:bifunctional folylpolyglutamate synthase/dihydrofolate synthase n=1 Tax=Aridibaculum aurantiacum TaxID=2810307 RepID=UPI001A95D1CF|nr:folylpolyglutamate synthase/dihydrofolate synthase family protein [Aridibaculum aurantiacum]
MNYQQTLEYLFTRLPMYSRIGAAAYKEDLTNTITLCNAVGNPQNSFKSIHIAGTNGKGSTSHMLAAILQSAGYKTGLYTSPHLKDFRERIKIDGKEIEEDFVVEFTHRLQPLMEEIEPSFFEITVAMAFKYFKQQQIDIAVIEVGLGGRLDSTNIITPEVSVITNIGMDHMNMLGDTIEKIASEKAGIIKPNIPAVIGETTEKTKPVFIDKAATVGAPVSFASEARWVNDWAHEKHQLVATVAHHQLDSDRQTYSLDLTGIYQLKNLLTVLETVHVLKQQGWKIEEEHVKHGLAHVKKLTGLHGRWEVVHQHPTVVLDVGHNEDGVKQIVQQLEHETFHKLHIVIGMVKDKEIEKVLSLLPTHATYYFTKASIPRALPEDELASQAAKYNLHGQTFPEVNAAVQHALAHAHKDDLILVCGSVFVVGEVEI